MSTAVSKVPGFGKLLPSTGSTVVFVSWPFVAAVGTRSGGVLIAQVQMKCVSVCGVARLVGRRG